jgi:hypothetical protein
MNKTLLFIIASICIIASVAMYVIGSGSSHLSELKDFWYTPLPLGLLAIFGALRKKQA